MCPVSTYTVYMAPHIAHTFLNPEPQGHAVGHWWKKPIPHVIVAKYLSLQCLCEVFESGVCEACIEGYSCFVHKAVAHFTMERVFIKCYSKWAFCMVKILNKRRKWLPFLSCWLCEGDLAGISCHETIQMTFRLHIYVASTVAPLWLVFVY